jgi:hypothetical protein
LFIRSACIFPLFRATLVKTFEPQPTSSPSSPQNPGAAKPFPEAHTQVEAFFQSNERPAADKDYVIYRGSRYALEVAVPKLDFSRLAMYGGISPQNAFYAPQEGVDDVMAAHVENLVKFGVSPPVQIPSEYERLVDEAVRTREGSSRSRAHMLPRPLNTLSKGGIGDEGELPGAPPVTSCL